MSITLADEVVKERLKVWTPETALMFGLTVEENEFWSFDDGPWLKVAPRYWRNVQGLRIFSDAMEPDYPRGSAVIIRRAQIHEVKSGDDCTICFNVGGDFRATFGRIRSRRVRKPVKQRKENDEGEGGDLEFEIRFLNDAYEPIVVAPHDIVIFGKVVQKVEGREC